jgi:hypothetical protein
MIEVIVPSGSHCTQTRPFDIVCSVVTTWSSPSSAIASSRPTIPLPGTSTIVGSPSTSITSRRRCVAAFATATPSPSPDAPIASSISCSSRAAQRACADSASACTHAIDEPGMMSWNCCSSTSFQSWSSSAATCSGIAPTCAHHSSASRNNRSHSRLPTFVRDWLVSVPRCISKYSSPRHTGTRPPAVISASTWSKKSATVPSVNGGVPSRSAIRRARSTISRVGPPPPLP